MKKLLLVLAALVACSAMVVETKSKCCKKSCKKEKCCPKKETSCARSCNTSCEQPRGIACCTRTEKRCVQVPCKKIVEKQVPREVWTSHIEYDTECHEVIEYKTVEQTRQVCDYNETEWSCPNGDCCSNSCTHSKCKAFCANRANEAEQGRLIPGSEAVIVENNGTIVPQNAHNIAEEKESFLGNRQRKQAAIVDSTAL